MNHRLWYSFVSHRCSPDLGASGRGGGVLWVALLWAIVSAPVVADAQGSEILVGSKVLVVNTEGQGLLLRNAPSQNSTVVVRAPEQSVLEVVGAERRAENRRWVQVRDSEGRTGWAAVEFLSVMSAPPQTIVVPPSGSVAAQQDPSSGQQVDQPTPTPTPEPTPVPPATPTPIPGAPLSVEPKVKVPETSDRRQTLTVAISRSGSPLSEVTVMAVTQNVDPPIVRELGTTDEEGMVSKSFEIKRDQGEKGTVVQVVVAVHPDGGTGWKAVSWFKR